MDLPCWYVEGKVLNHAWNIIGIDGKYYYADVTWDDGDLDTDYFYFAKGSQYFSEDHGTNKPDRFIFMNGLPEVEEEDHPDIDLEDHPT